MNLRNKFALAAALFASLSAHAHAQQVCCPPMGDCCSPEQSNQATFFADFLWWKADVESTEVASYQARTTNFAQLTTNNAAEIIKPNGKWKPGVRVGASYRPNPCDTMDLSLTWTYLYSRSNHICRTASTNYYNMAFEKADIISPYAPTLVGPSAQKIEADWRLKTNILDFDLGKEYFPSCNLSLRPHAGIRGAWFNFKFNQDFVGNWYAFQSPSTTPIVFAHDTFLYSQFTYKGVGLKIGTDGAWHFADHWSILAKISGSLLYGKYNFKETLAGFQPDPLPDGFPALLPWNEFFKDDAFRVRTNLEGFLGLTWKTGLCNDRYNIGLSIGYDISQWFQLNSLPVFEDSVQIYEQFNVDVPELSVNTSYFQHAANGDISYQGLSVRASFDF